MRRQAVLIAILAAMVATFGALVAACGDGDALTLDEYFEQLEAMDADVDAQFEAAFAEFPEDEDIFADDANLPFFKDLIAAFPRITGESLDRVEDLELPSEVADAHNDLLAALQALLVAYEEGADALNEAETMAEASVLIEEAETTIEPAITRFETACLALVDIAEANGISVNISCEDDV